MQVALSELYSAFLSSKLPQLGYTFDKALNNKGLAICLKHLAERKAPQQLEPVRVKKSASIKTGNKTYWYQKI